MARNTSKKKASTSKAKTGTKAAVKKASAKKAPSTKKSVQTATPSARTKAPAPKSRPASSRSAPVKKKGAAKPPAAKAAAKKPSPATKPKPSKAAAPKKKAPAAKTAPPKKAAPPKPVAAIEPKPSKPAPKPPVAEAIPAPAKKPAAPRVRRHPLERGFLVELCTAIKEAVLPSIRAIKGREVVGLAASGDATFELDRVAEKALLNFLKRAQKPVAYYSEDAGYATFTSSQPEQLLIIDPIDGTRAAKSGFEGCTVCVAVTPVIEQPCVADLESAMVMELTSDRVFYAERGKGARIYTEGAMRKPKPSTNANLESISWAMTVPARPAELIFPTAARLIDLSSLKGGFFACNSTSYSITRLLTNQLDACVDFANRFMRDIPDVVADQFINAGRGAPLGIAPYDMVAALLIAEEAGCILTDAYGNGFDELRLLDSSASNHQSLLAAANRELHEKLMTFFDTRISQFEALLQRRASLHL